MGTTPTNGLSQLQLNATSSNAIASVKFWPLHGNRAYQLLSRPELGAPVWQNISTNPIALPQGQGAFVVNTTNAPHGFYRLRVLMATNNGNGSLLSTPARTLLAPQLVEEVCGPFRVYVR